MTSFQRTQSRKEGRQRNLTVEMSDTRDLRQLIRVNGNRDNPVFGLCLPSGVTGAVLYLCGLLLKADKPRSVMGKTANSGRGTFYKILDSCFLKTSILSKPESVGNRHNQAEPEEADD